jgi:hypothetical protein
MFDIPINLNPIPDAATLDAVFGPGLRVLFMVWLAIAGAACLALLPIALRSGEPKRIEIADTASELRDAA